MISERIDEAVKETRRRGELFRKGRVTALDATAVPNLVTINGRQMAVLGSDVAVGDLVVYIDQHDPFAISKFAGT